MLRLLRLDAAALGFKPHVIALDHRPVLSAACAEADLALRVPPASDAEFVPTVLEICGKEGARLVVPTIDTELAPLAAMRGEFRTQGTLVAVSAPSAVAVARDKAETAKVLGAAGILVPRTALPVAVLADPGKWRWPVIAKPPLGSSSIGLALPENPDELARLCALHGDLIVQERVVGHEFTINMFVDEAGVCRCVVPHFRREVRTGEVSKGVVVRDAPLSALARRVAESVPGFYGAVCFQVITTAAGPCVIEINARFGGGFPLAHRAGARFTRWLIEAAAGLPLTADDHWQDGTWMLRYDAAVYGASPPEEVKKQWFA